jgi:uncharacterized membrane protein
MERKPSFWRAWYPLIYQLLGIALVCIASILPFGRWDMIGVFFGLCLWLLGIGRRRSAERSGQKKSD